MHGMGGLCCAVLIGVSPGLTIGQAGEFDYSGWCFLLLLE